MNVLAEPLTIAASAMLLSDEQFYQLCRQNEALRFELSAEGELIVMSPVGGESGKREMALGSRVWNWNEAAQLGEVFSSSTIFRLPNGAKRSPDVAWVRGDRWASLTREEREQFPPIVPDFVIELRSATDGLASLQRKMVEYRDCGVRLGWLINPQDERVEIYRPGMEVEEVELPAVLSGEDVLLGFELELRRFDPPNPHYEGGL
ncbi:Uma2 family endonuclease [Alkalinema sp. FACHB-956]|uniref:Uma2 family endonuclease n=1 Tax=Alkalinema sp. FACHB-956 TaxID=2692768 RepID=UPI001685B56E|nr:Uma2 family endonuclease [Alkalinema sp. FACHB-956]MBD2328490.1 Uma2 family endonuclease [Alkalinema sp. FACHB-956]